MAFNKLSMKDCLQICKRSNSATNYLIQAWDQGLQVRVTIDCLGNSHSFSMKITDFFTKRNGENSQGSIWLHGRDIYSEKSIDLPIVAVSHVEPARQQIDCHITRCELGGDRRLVEGTAAECFWCGHVTESFGTSQASIDRCLSLMREECPEELDKWYVEE